LERGAAQATREELLDGDEVFEELCKLIEDCRQPKKNAGLAENG
jgi:hypothetical protein